VHESDPGRRFDHTPDHGGVIRPNEARARGARVDALSAQYAPRPVLIYPGVRPEG